MGKRARRHFTPEFKAEAIKLAREGRAAGRSLESIAKDIGVWPATLGDWLRRAKPSSEEPVKDAPAATAREQELLKEIRLLRMERDILKKAAAFFAKEST